MCRRLQPMGRTLANHLAIFDFANQLVMLRCGQSFGHCFGLANHLVNCLVCPIRWPILWSPSSFCLASPLVTCLVDPLTNPLVNGYDQSFGHCYFSGLADPLANLLVWQIRWPTFWFGRSVGQLFGLANPFACVLVFPIIVS